MAKQVFTDEFINGLPPSCWLFQVSTHKQFEAVRGHIEEFIDLTGDHKLKIIRQFQNPTMAQFWDTYKELMVGAILRECGVHASYSPKIIRSDGLIQTPDWVLFDADGHPSLIVEVTSLHGNQTAAVHRSFVEDFRLKLLQRLPTGFNFKLSDYTSPDADLAPETHARIIESIAIFIEHSASSLPDNHQVELDDLDGGFGFSGTLVYNCNDSGEPTVFEPYIYIGSADGYDMDRFRKSVNKKVEKYENLCLELKCPFIVSICPEFWANIFPSVVDYSLNRIRYFDRISKILSGIWICDCEGNWFWRSHLIINPNADQKTPGTINDKWCNPTRT